MEEVQNIVKVHDLSFQTFLDQDKILKRVHELGAQISQDYQGKRPLLIGVLNGAFMFASDLMKSISEPCEVTFVRMASYAGTESTGKVRRVIELQEDIVNRDIIIIEDIVDSGRTMEKALEYFQSFEPSSMKIASLLFKPECLKVDLKVDYVGFEIPEKFVVGYGLDYNGLGRNLKDIYQLKQE